MDQEKSQEEKKPSEKTNEATEQKPQPDEETDEEGEELLSDIEPFMKRRKVTVPFTDKQEDDLVVWFKDNVIFYNQSLREFKLKDKKVRLMLEKAKEFNISLAEQKTWLSSMQTTFGMLSKLKKSGQAARTVHQ